MNILEMTHEELMKSSMEVRSAYKEAKYNELYERLKNLFESGFKHIQLGNGGCIIMKKNKNGIYYVVRNGKGTGADCGKYSDLQDCVNSVKGCGWYNRDTLSIK
jgi:hypothetical protein